ncbi:MAG TPA: molybdopterin-dependent oxidoreductase, partial [Anaerolineales bacterium]
MKRISYLQTGVLGGLTAIVLMALSYIGAKLMSLPFLPFDIFDWMARYLPGGIINFVIDSQVKLITSLRLGPTASTAKLVENGIAIVQFIVAGILFGLFLGWVGRRQPQNLISTGTVAGLIAAGVMIFIEATYRFPAAGAFISILWLVIILASWGGILGRLIRETAPLPFETKPQPLSASVASPATPVARPTVVVKSASEINAPPNSALSRRQFLTLVGAGSVTILVTAAGLKVLQQPATIPETGSPVPTEDIAKINTSSGPAASPSQSVLAGRFKPVTGTRSEITPNDQFYRIDINSDPPVIDGSSWRLQFTGLVDKPLNLSLAEISSRPSITQAVTMSCISNEIGGDLIGTTLWTGVPFKDILVEAGLQSGVQSINIKAVDGFYESVPIEEAMDGRTMLVYQMNGQPLPVEHGFPLRIYIP